MASDRKPHAAPPTLRLFGAPVLMDGGHQHPFASERRYQLLAYLACRQDWVSRAELSTLFWDSLAGEAARRNLRRLLHDIRRIDWVCGVEARGESLRWPIDTDLHAFSEACSRRDWAGAIELFDAELLQGIEDGAPDPFHEWLRYEREVQRGRWRDAVANRRIELQDDPQARVDLAMRVLRLDPHDEASLRDLVDALRALGRETEAQRYFDQFAQRLRDDLGVEPTLQLRYALAKPKAMVNVPMPKPAAIVPAVPDLVGRKLELAELIARITDERCRRLTIIGPGGVGKSSLARAAQQALRAEFADGVHAVPFRDISTEAQIPARIAEACGLKLTLSQDPLAAIAARIGERRALLVFDNCEHLPEIAAAASRLIAACPGLKILQTSRSRTGGEGEWLLLLTGLAIPDPEEREVEMLRAFDSVRLFEMRAREVDPRFDLQAAAGDVAALVRRVEGLPLALEMAAASLRVLPVAEIVRDLSRLMDMPAPAGLLAPAGDRTLRASFEHSWNLLAERERSTLAQLSIFSGSFSLEAAKRVAGAELVVIASLADKSLLACGNLRFWLHPLIREFAAEHLEDDAAARARHCAYFAEALGARFGGAPGDVKMPWSEEDVSNCLDAWRWAATVRSLPLLQRMAIPMTRLFNRYLRWQEGIDTLGAALLRIDSPEVKAEHLRAALYYGASLCQLYSGKMDAAEEAARRSLRTCRSLGVGGELVTSNLYVIGFALAWRGEMEQARRYFEQCLRRATAQGEWESVSKARYGLAFLEQAAGRWDQARNLYGLNQEQCRDRGMHQWLALSLNGLGAVAMGQKRWDEAVEALDEGIRVCTENEVHGRRSFLLSNRGLALLHQGDAEGARKSMDRALDEAREWNIWTARVDAHLSHSALELATGETAAALGHVQEAMANARSAQSAVRLLTVARHWGQWLVKAQRPDEGHAVLEFVRADSRSMRKDKDMAEEQISLLGASPRMSAAAVSAAASIDLARLERAVLETRH